MLNSNDKLREIFKKSKLSLSKFANIIAKDRRTLTQWIEKDNSKGINLEVQKKICDFFRYPLEIWQSSDKEFYRLLHEVKNSEIKIIDEGYLGGLKYIYEHENEGSLILHPTFPNPAYRDFIAPFVYKNIDSEEIKIYRQKRGDKMRDYSFVAKEWYSIKSLLEFCFSPIGNFYTKEQKIQILELMIYTFKDNFNKALYFFDSYDKKIYGLDMFYLSLNIKENSMFFKAPLEMLIVEIQNSSLIEKIHHHYTHAKKCPAHVDPKDACFIMQILIESLKKDFDILKTCKRIEEENAFYGKLFQKSLSLDLKNEI